MKERNKTAILLGGTGLTGGILLQNLLEDSRYEKVKLFSRSSVGFEHPKLHEFLGDVLHLEKFRNDFTADVVFCCIGTTANKTPNKDVYRKIDYGIPLEAAKIAKQNKVEKFIVISALGSDPNSSIFYNRIKGEMEAAVLEVGLPDTFILRPSLIGGKRQERRLGEWLMKQFMKVFNFFLIGSIKKYRSIHPDYIARTMLWLDTNEFEKIRIESDEILKLGAV